MSDLRRSCRRRMGRLLGTAALVLAGTPAAHATGFVESADYSNDPAHPTLLGTLTPGGNLINGTIDSYGQPVGPHGELTNQDMDYVTFTVPTGYVLSQFTVSSGTSILTAPRVDSLFLGLASGGTVSIDPSFSSAAGLLGWALVTQSQVGSDILSTIGSPILPPSPGDPNGTPRYPGFPVPGATGFSAPLGAGTYTLWLYDGDAPASYSFNLVTSAVPELATWAMMVAGFGAIGVTLRRRTRQGVAVLA